VTNSPNCFQMNGTPPIKVGPELSLERNKACNDHTLFVKYRQRLFPLPIAASQSGPESCAFKGWHCCSG